MTALVVLSVVLAVVGLVTFVALCLAIRREDHSPRLTSRPPTAGTAVTRSIAGLCVRRAEAATPTIQPEPRTALRPAPWPYGPNEGR
jgi:hypothetical protein